MNARALLVAAMFLGACTVVIPDWTGVKCDTQATCGDGTEYACVSGTCRRYATDAGALAPQFVLVVSNATTANQSAGDGGTTSLTVIHQALDAWTSRTPAPRLGLSLFPTSAACGPATAMTVALPDPSAVDDAATQAAADANARTVHDAVANALPSVIGHPIANVLSVVNGAPAVDPKFGRPTVVIVITDGTPDCNSAPTPACTNVATTTCACTRESGFSCKLIEYAGVQSVCNLDCVDDARTVGAVAALKARGIRTAVVAVGYRSLLPLEAKAFETYKQMAEAGGLMATCPHGSDDECGGAPDFRCDGSTHLCNKAFHFAATADQLRQALENIAASAK